MYNVRTSPQVPFLLPADKILIENLWAVGRVVVETTGFSAEWGMGDCGEVFLWRDMECLEGGLEWMAASYRTKLGTWDGEWKKTMESHTIQNQKCFAHHHSIPPRFCHRFLTIFLDGSCISFLLSSSHISLLALSSIKNIPVVSPCRETLGSHVRFTWHRGIHARLIVENAVSETERREKRWSVDSGVSWAGHLDLTVCSNKNGELYKPQPYLVIFFFTRLDKSVIMWDGHFSVKRPWIHFNSFFSPSSSIAAVERRPCIESHELQSNLCVLPKAISQQFPFVWRKVFFFFFFLLSPHIFIPFNLFLSILSCPLPCLPK